MDSLGRDRFGDAWGATSERGSGVVGYNVQVAVDTMNHLIVTHEVTNTGSDRSQLANVAREANAVLQVPIAC